MHFQKYEQYGLLFMGELARAKDTDPLSLVEMSRRHGVSVPFLKKIARSLHVAGLVQSKEGMGGGYTLVRKPTSISLWEIIAAMGTATEVGKPIRSVCPVNKSCLPQHIRSILAETIRERLRAVSLSMVAL